MNNQNLAPKAQRSSVAAEIIDLSEKVACYSDDVLNCVDTKLQSVMRLEEVQNDDKEAEAARILPSLFEVLRKNLWRTERNLKGISNCIAKTEL